MIKVGRTLDENAETFNQIVFSCREVIFFGKSESLFGKVSTDNCKNSFLKFVYFLTKFSFLKVHLSVPGRSLVSFLSTRMSVFRLTAKLTAKMFCVCEECKCTWEMSTCERTLKFLINKRSWSKRHYSYKKACEIFSASSTRTNILIWRYVNEQIL